jgi:hypothetical protein
MEEYLESRATEIAIKASVAAQAGSINHVAACLLAFSDSHFGPPPDTLVPPTPNQAKAWPERVDIQERTRTISSNFIAYLKMENHGIRERNFLRIVLPIGFRTSAIDNVLLTELDSFGQLRGQFAHTSAARHIKSRPDPKDELDRVRKIVHLMLGVDQEMDRLLRLVSNP